MKYKHINNFSWILVLWLVEMNRLSRDSHPTRGDYRMHMSLEIVLQKEVSEIVVSYSFSYQNHPFDDEF